MGAIVIAESEELCDEALKLFRHRMEVKPFILDQEESLAAGAPEIWYNTIPYPRPLGGNIIRNDNVEHGDMEAGFIAADHIIEWRTTRAKIIRQLQNHKPVLLNISLKKATSSFGSSTNQ